MISFIIWFIIGWIIGDYVGLRKLRKQSQKLEEETLNLHKDMARAIKETRKDVQKDAH